MSTPTLQTLTNAETTVVPGSNNTRGRNQGRRSRRVKCTYPGCGKFGHFTSQCWLAHPELRPPWGTARNRGRRRLRNTEILTNSTSRPRTPSPPPFRLLDLLQQVQDKIYSMIYEKDLVVVMKCDNRKQHKSRMTEEDWERVGGRFPLGVMFSRGSSDGGLPFVSKKVHNDARLARLRDFNGHLAVYFDERHVPEAFEKICEDKFQSLRERVTTLGFNQLSSRTTSAAFSSEFWESMVPLFPQVKEIRLHYEVFRYVNRDRESDVETLQWQQIRSQGYDAAFAEGRLDHKFAYPADILMAHDLAKCMDRVGRDCRIYMTTSATWQDNRYCVALSGVRIYLLLPISEPWPNKY